MASYRLGAQGRRNVVGLIKKTLVRSYFSFGTSSWLCSSTATSTVLRKIANVDNIKNQAIF